MLTIFFFYGLAFIVLAAVIFLLPGRKDYLGIGKTIVFLGWFGLIHGLNEWVDLLILAGRPFDVNILSIIGSFLLPLSFMFLIIFGSVTISNVRNELSWLNVSWIVLPVLWMASSIAINDCFVSSILARYILCVPGTILTSVAIYYSLKKRGVNNLPGSAVIGAWLLIFFFLLYGVLSGLITQKAVFLPASIFNYDKFIEIFNIPIQLFRMICALLISCGASLVLGAFSFMNQGLAGYIKGTIKQKLTLIITVSVAVVVMIGAILTYFAGFATLTHLLGKEYSQIAHSLNSYIINSLEDAVEDIRSYTTRTLWKDILIEHNLQYKGMTEEEIKKKLLDLDKKWIAAKPGDPFLSEYLDTKISLGMKDAQKARLKISELFITDKYGGLVASSNRTSDFYQADEKWWQIAYNNGKGDIYVSDIEFDDSSQDWVISIALPIMDYKGEVIGVCKDSISVEKLFKSLSDFKIGDTGHAILIDNNGAIIFHHKLMADIKRVISKDTLSNIFLTSRSYMAVDDGMLHNRRAFIAFSEAKPPYISKKGASWIVLVIQDMSEVYEPIHNFIIQISIIYVLMLVLIIPVGSFFGRLVSDPIQKLHLAMEKVMAGDWDYKVNVNTGDEIEQFADTFNNMISDIKNKQRQLESFSKELESKVEERTKELNMAQEATLNILEDLQISKEKLEATNKELMKLDELKSEFISTVSHELRTPLSIIKEGISLILDKIPGEVNEKQLKILDISKYNIDRLARIIDSLLDISKIEAGKVELRRNLIKVSDVVRQAAKSFENKIKDKGLEMRLDIDEVKSSVWADADRITQVLTNLIGNAVKFTNSGHISISCKDKGDNIVCSIADTGIGISKEDMPKVFDKFQQFGRIPGAGEKGTGLGLSIAKHIVDMHNGSMWVDSEFGKGTKFTFTLHKYTPQSLYDEHISKAIQKAKEESKKMSIIAMKAIVISEDELNSINRKFDDIMYEIAKLIKSTLRREGDDVVNSGSDIIVIAADCGKESAIRVRYRAEEIANKYLDGYKINTAIKINYGLATYPDDAKSGIEMVEKAMADLNTSAKA